jgi:Ca-activated chloride channel family protein
MRANDIKPSRLGAAESAAISFIEKQKSTTQIGLVAFSNFAEIIQAPTTNEEDLQAAIESLTVGRRTAVGEGILRAIDAIAAIDKNVAPSVPDPTSDGEPAPVPKGMYAPDIIVLLTDGVSNAGILPLDAAKEAADRGIRVYTIGYGTDQGGTIPFGGPGFSDPFGGGFGGGGFGGGGFGGGRGFRMGIDEDTMKQVASMTGGEYYLATSASELNNVFRSLPTYLIVKHETSEISVVFAAAGALLAGLAVVLSLVWHPVI